MNQKTKVLTLLLALVLLLGGAYVLYGRLSAGAEPEQLVVQTPLPEEAPAETTQTAPAETEAPAEPPEPPSAEAEQPEETAPAVEAEPEDAPPVTETEQWAEAPEPPPAQTEPPAEESETPPAEEAEPQTVPAPDFTVFDPQGNPVRLSEYQGKPVVLNFWASWCTYCKLEMPAFEEKFLELGEEVTFLMVNVTGGQETQESAAAYIAEQGYTFPVYYDLQQEAAMAYGTYSLPVTYFIDAAGSAVAYAAGAINAETLQRGIDLIR